MRRHYPGASERARRWDSPSPHRTDHRRALSGASAADLDADPPVVRGWGPVEREQTSLGVFLLCVLAVIVVCSIGTCGDIEDPGGPDRVPAEVRRDP